MKPIDADDEPPAPSRDRDHVTITADIERAFAAEIRQWIDAMALEGGYTRREAAARVLRLLREARLS